jgi:AhpD family alkylhydroperoxidase
MPRKTIDAFMKERDGLNEIVMKYAGKNLKKLYNLDMNAYKAGALDRRTKELLALVASLVLRCDDCILYHLDRCRDEGISSAELEEALSIGVLVGGTVTIPHLRRALRAWDEMQPD